MGRKIKFRAWDSIGKQWLWITGIETAETRKSEGYTFGGMFHDGDYVGNEGIEFMQFTGLIDKEGCEIYEGDILSYEDGEFSFVAEVGWVDWHWSLEGASDTFSFADITDDGQVDAEVIGNIYEHPNILEQS